MAIATKSFTDGADGAGALAGAFVVASVPAAAVFAFAPVLGMDMTFRGVGVGVVAEPLC